MIVTGGHSGANKKLISQRYFAQWILLDRNHLRAEWPSVLWLPSLRGLCRPYFCWPLFWSLRYVCACMVATPGAALSNDPIPSMPIVSWHTTEPHQPDRKLCSWPKRKEPLPRNSILILMIETPISFLIRTVSFVFIRSVN